MVTEVVTGTLKRHGPTPGTPIGVALTPVWLGEGGGEAERVKAGETH